MLDDTIRLIMLVLICLFFKEMPSVQIKSAVTYMDVSSSWDVSAHLLRQTKSLRTHHNSWHMDLSHQCLPQLIPKITKINTSLLMQTLVDQSKNEKENVLLIYL